ncbi:cytochrome c biogenesis CcdA family protein [Paenibacillus sp. L3-i20]|uniref:cytochrome c biogenesis CcdA family protein n=1 Tax=Paenibacillus sp. L3-i20 TaxID=2905833 RepID=UPI001EDD970F|nr:cytochrome c biogenesis protein CcdA [Paenibacillus sp. L3-i20]GKU79051.1 cytochrome C biogenesis protein CcdA [Paenibacillus sp. L3-i20]
MNTVTLLIAVAAGALSFLSPCVFPLVPAYVSHLTGASIMNGKIEVERKLLVMRSISFIVGFSLVFIAMGASATMVGSLLAEYRDLVQMVSGFLIIVFGMQMMGWLNLRWLMSNKTWDAANVSTNSGMTKSFLTGLAFGSGWTPCVGLALSSILLMASTADTMWSGILLLALYSLGLGIPFLLIAVLLTVSTGIISKMNRYVPLLSTINGLIFITLGLLLFTGQMQKIGACLARYALFDISL